MSSVVAGVRPRLSVRKDLKYSLFESFLSSAMIGAGETFLPAFALALGASAVTAGILGAVPFLIGSTLQLAAPRVLAKVGCYRACVAWLAALQAFSFIPFVWSSYHGETTSIWVYSMMVTIYWAAGLSGAATWQSWMTRIVPMKIRTRYFAKRNHVGQIGLLFGLVAGGVLLHTAKQEGLELKAFAALFLFSGLARFISAFCLRRQTSCSVKETPRSHLTIRQLISKLHRGTEGSIFRFLLLFAVGVNISSPFFNPYIIRHLKFSYHLYVLLTAAAYIAKIATFSSISRRTRQMDPYKLMYFGLIGAALTPAVWIFSTNFLYLIGIQLLSGTFWAMYELGLILVLFGAVRDDERTQLVSFFNFASSFMVVIGTGIGALFLSELGENSQTYFLIFGLSTGARLLCLILFERAVVKIKGAITYKARLLIFPEPSKMLKAVWRPRVSGPSSPASIPKPEREGA